MEEIKAIIIDDEKDSRDIIKIYLSEYFPSIKVVDEADSVKTGLESLTKNNIDILFLDIQLKNDTSFEILNQLTDITFEIVFITAHDEYAIQAIKHHALDYILKPIEREEFKTSVNLFINKRGSSNSTNIKNLLSYIEVAGKTKQIKLPTLNGFKVVKIKDIIHLESDRNYTNFYLTNNRKILVSKTLKEFEKILENKQFCRIHHSHIINLDYVKEYIKGRGGQVILNNNKTISVSQSKKQNLLDYWK